MPSRPGPGGGRRRNQSSSVRPVRLPLSGVVRAPAVVGGSASAGSRNRCSRSRPRSRVVVRLVCSSGSTRCWSSLPVPTVVRTARRGASLTACASPPGLDVASAEPSASSQSVRPSPQVWRHCSQEAVAAPAPRPSMRRVQVSRSPSIRWRPLGHGTPVRRRPGRDHSPWSAYFRQEECGFAIPVIVRTFVGGYPAPCPLRPKAVVLPTPTKDSSCSSTRTPMSRDDGS